MCSTTEWSACANKHNVNWLASRRDQMPRTQKKMWRNCSLKVEVSLTTLESLYYCIVMWGRGSTCWPVAHHDHFQDGIEESLSLDDRGDWPLLIWQYLWISFVEESRLVDHNSLFNWCISFIFIGWSSSNNRSLFFDKWFRLMFSVFVFWETC